MRSAAYNGSTTGADGGAAIKKRIWIPVGVLIGLIVAGAVALPLLVDANRYRGLIQQHASDTLGREVRLGEMRLSFLPVFGVRVDDVAVAALAEEGGGDLLTAGSLRVGARLLPLLSRRLEMTSVVIQDPRLTLVRGPDGTWNVQRLLATEPAAGDASPTGTTPLRVARFRVNGGRIQIRDLMAGKDASRELTLDDLALSVVGFANDRPFDFQLETSLAELGPARITVEGRAGPIESPAGEPLQLKASVNLSRLDPARLAPFLESVLTIPTGLLGNRTTSLSLQVDASFGETARVVLQTVRLEGIELALRRDRDGRWGLPTLVPARTGEPQAGDTFELLASDLKIDGATLQIRDEASAGPDSQWTLDKIRLSLDRLPLTESAALDFQASLNGGGLLTASGRLGPLAAEGNTPAELRLSAPAVPLSLIQNLLGQAVIEGGRGTAAIDVEISGTPPERFGARGSLGVKGATVRLDGPDGKPRSAPVDMTARFDVGVEGGGTAFDIRDVGVTVGSNRLAARGRVRQEGPLHRIDLELLPARMPADDIAALMATLGQDLPVAFASQTPVELQGRVRGLVGGDRLPDIEGSAKLRDFTFRHPSMQQPIEQVGADVSLSGQTVEIRNLSGVVGSSDVGGQITLTGFDSPAVRFDLQSRRADFGELFSFLETPASSEESTATGDPLADMVLDGRLRIGVGSFETLDFGDLETTMKWRDGIVTLDPLRMKVYDGTFAGRVVGDLRTETPKWEIDGQVDRVDVDAFLADNADAPGLLSGRFTGKVATRTVGADYESIVRGLDGSGVAEVRDGRVGKLDVLKSLSRVSGVFGESTLRRLSKQMATEGTDFQALTGTTRMAGGQMNLDNLVLDSSLFRLTGAGRLDLLSTDFSGQFRLILSPEVSALMREEKSRAAELFWNSRTQQVELPFALAGPFDAPTPSVDFKGIVGDAIKDRAKDRVGGIIENKLGLDRVKEAAPTVPPAAAPPAPTEAGDAPSPPVEADPAVLAAEISRTRWGGSLLARDLKIEGRVRGAGIDSATLVVSDARGIEIRRIDRIQEVEAAVAAAADPAAPAVVNFTAAIDGKRLALAKFPVQVKVIVRGREGGVAETSVEVDR